MKRKAEESLELEVEKEDEKDMCNHGVAWSRGPLIGRGGFGSVYLATSKKAKSRNGFFPSVMAVKSAEVSVSSSLQKEKEVFDRLQGCPYILKCFGEEVTGAKDGEMVYNVLLEYASGGTLASLIKKANSCSGFPESDARRYTKSILEGIDFIHSCGYVHCDLKPENILLVPSNADDGKFVAKIGDFGLAKKAERGSTKRRKFDPYIGGTALYMAPEVVVDHVQEPPCDVWALGCIVFEMLTGRPVWDLKPNATTTEILRKVGDRYELPKIPPEISKDAKEFLKGCLVKKPMFRLTTEMLLGLPFVSGLDEFVAADKSTVCDANDEFSATSSSKKDWSFVSEECGSPSCWSDDSPTSFVTATEDELSLRSVAKDLPDSGQPYHHVFTISAGV